MIRLETDMGSLFIRTSEILAITPERGRDGCSMIYCGLFPEGISINKSPLEILEMIVAAESWEVSDEEE